MADPARADGDGRDELAAAVVELEDVFGRIGQQHRLRLAQQAEELRPGLSLGAMRAFVSVCHAGPLTPSALAEQIMVDRTQVSRLVRVLEEDGLIRREPDPQDRRSTLLSATDEGRARLAAVRGEDLHAVLSDWDPEDVRTLSRLLTRLKSLD